MLMIFVLEFLARDHGLYRPKFSTSVLWWNVENF